MNSPDPQRVRAVALLRMYERVVPDLMRNLSGIRDHVDRVLERQSVSRDAWVAMSISEREALLRKDRRSQA